MSTFARRLPKRALAALEALMSSQTSWWPDLLAHWAPSGSEGCLRLAIRNGYANFYSSGQSIAKVTFGHGGNAPTLSVHEKYVSGPSAQGQRYVKFSGEGGNDADGCPTDWAERLRKWISNSVKHRGKEKPCIEAVVAASPKVIDLEMGLPAVDGRKTALRMDIVSLERTTDGIRLVFWEGKMIGDGRLRSKVHNPRVFEQVDAYSSYLQDGAREQRIVKAYRESCRIIRDLHGMASTTTMARLDPLILAAAESDSRLDIEKQPRLVIFDDGKERREDSWQEHLGVLRKKVPVAIVQCGTETLTPLESIPRAGG